MNKLKQEMKMIQMKLTQIYLFSLNLSPTFKNSWFPKSNLILTTNFWKKRQPIGAS